MFRFDIFIVQRPGVGFYQTQRRISHGCGDGLIVGVRWWMDCLATFVCRLTSFGNIVCLLIYLFLIFYVLLYEW